MKESFIIYQTPSCGGVCPPWPGCQPDVLLKATLIVISGRPLVTFPRGINTKRLLCSNSTFDREYCRFERMIGYDAAHWFMAMARDMAR